MPEPDARCGTCEAEYDAATGHCCPERLARLDDKLNVLAVALDALITAMKAGAIGKWTP